MSKKRLIHLIKQHESLYNTDSILYRDPSMRNVAWEEISEKLNMPVAQCKDDWAKLRNCYTNAMKRREKKSDLSPWKYDSQMSFLLPYMKSRPTQNSVSIENINAYKEAANISYDSSSSESEVSNSNYELDSKNSQLIKREIKPSIEIRKRKMETDIANLDDTDLFFLSMCQSVKKLPKIDQVKIKMDLHMAVNQAEMRQIYDEANNASSSI